MHFQNGVLSLCTHLRLLCCKIHSDSKKGMKAQLDLKMERIGNVKCLQLVYSKTDWDWC